MVRIPVFCLAAAVSAASFGCVHERTDVPGEIDSVALSIEGGKLSGTVDVSYVNLGTERVTLSDPELQLLTGDGFVKAIDLVYPEGFDPVFDPGEEVATTYVIDGGTGWDSFCDTPLELQENHHGKPDGGPVYSSLGAAFKVTLPCK